MNSNSKLKNEISICKSRIKNIQSKKDPSPAELWICEKNIFYLEVLKKKLLIQKKEEMEQELKEREQELKERELRLENMYKQRDNKIKQKKIKEICQYSDILSDIEIKKLTKLYSGITSRHRLKKHVGEIINYNCFVDQFIKQQNLCYYSKLPFGCGDVKSCPTIISVDRINSKLGYVEGNVVFCCWFVNAAKNQYDIEILIPLWKELVKNLN